MKDKIQQFELADEEANENKEKLAKLYELGMIYSDGEVNENRRQE